MARPGKARRRDTPPYPGLAHPQLHPDALRLRARVRGVEAAPASRCRLLELGCGDGTHLLALASACPGARFLGLDIDAESIARGTAEIRACGLTNIELRVADVGRVRTPYPGSWDFVVAHGLYSWVPARVRPAILRLAARALAPRGVACISYLTLPGAFLREISASLMRRQAAPGAPAAERLAQGLALLGYAARGRRLPSLYNQLLAEDLAFQQGRDPSVLLHDELAAHGEARYLDTFCAEAGEAGLQFLGEAEYLLPNQAALSDEAIHLLQDCGADRLALEQYHDLFTGRRFRQTLLVHASQSLRPEVSTALLREAHLGFGADPQEERVDLGSPAPLRFQSGEEAWFEASEPWLKACLLTLRAEAPFTLPWDEMLTRARRLLPPRKARGGPPSELEQGLTALCLPRLLEAWCEPPPAARKAGPHPLAAAWTRGRAASGRPVINLRQQCVGVLSAEDRALLSLLDGRPESALAAHAGLSPETLHCRLAHLARLGLLLA